EGAGLWLRLVSASLVLLIPGALVARALRVRGASATVAWTLGALGVALAVVFLVHTGIWVALLVLGVVALAALVPALRAGAGPPAAVPIFFLLVREPSWRLAATLAALGLEVFLVHASTAVFLALPLAGFVVARLLLARDDVRSAPAALAALLVPAGVALVWLAPIVDETASHSPSTSELRRSLVKYGGELDVDSLHRYSLQPEVISR